MRILVTGSSGFIGFHTSLLLLKKRHEVELEEFREKLSKAEQELQEQLEYQEQKPDKMVINIDESVNVKSDDDVKGNSNEKDGF